MWIDDDLVVHTVSPPDPTTVIGHRAAAVLSALGELEREKLESALEELRERFFVRLRHGQIAGPGIVEELPPGPVLPESITDTDELVAAIKSLPDVWRLDAIEACQEVLDSDEDA